MQYVRMGEVLLALTLGLSAAAWGQGGNGRAGRAAGAQAAGTPATAPAAAQGRGGRGAETGAGATEFYNYDPAAGSGTRDPGCPSPSKLTRRSPSTGNRSLTRRAPATCPCAMRPPAKRKLICFTPATRKTASLTLLRDRCYFFLAARLVSRPPGRTSAAWARNG